MNEAYALGEPVVKNLPERRLTGRLPLVTSE
jgi:hypothetical protein